MNKYIHGASALGLALMGSFGLTTSPAEAGSICLTDNDSSSTYQSCDFYSYAQCRASSSGTGGSCITNPGVDGSYAYALNRPVGFGDAYNRYEGPVRIGPAYGGGYVRTW